MLSSIKRSYSSAAVTALINKIKARDPHQPEFIQAMGEVVESLEPVFEKNPKYIEVMARIAEPERAIQFRVPWMDDKGKVQYNRGFRVQYNSAIGPYKGGMRLHPSVNLSILKFLGFEQIFKNALTTLPMGGGKGGSDFDPKGKSDAEVERFCVSLMTELYRHIGQFKDVPAGDIGVGGREIGYMFSAYKRITGEVVGVLTGKGLSYGGSLIRPEATGYGCVWFAEEMLKTKNQELKGKKCLVSGSGNVAQYTVELLQAYGAIPLTMSDSTGYIYEPEGFTKEQLAHVMWLKNVKRGRINEYCDFSKTGKFVKGKRPWEVPCDLAFPSATQNEINGKDAKNLVSGGCYLVSEGANMPSDSEAIDCYKENSFLYGPGKAANAGGVATSGLEMSQNSLRLSWTREEVSTRLHDIMVSIHKQAYDASKMFGKEGDLQVGANAAGFIKVANAMLAYGTY